MAELQGLENSKRSIECSSKQLDKWEGGKLSSLLCLKTQRAGRSPGEESLGVRSWKASDSCSSSALPSSSESLPMPELSLSLSAPEGAIDLLS